jgi:murein DD-endopeptidase MepM/ murein hydrolase activator NlpD
MLIHLFQVALVFSALYLLYILCLQKLTFHAINRSVLLLLLPISLFIPFFDDLFPSLTRTIVEIPLFAPVPFESLQTPLQYMTQPVDTSFDYTWLFLSIYWAGVGVFLWKIIRNTRKLLVFKRKAQMHQKNGYQLVFANVTEIFSYFNTIYIPKGKADQFNPEILKHEQIHIALKHSWDVILAELYIAFFWFNPLLYFFRKSLKSIHEYQADNGVLQNGAKTSEYLELVMESLNIEKPNNLYNYFNQPLLKRRIQMMTTSPSKGYAKFMYLILIPLCILLFSAFASSSDIQKPYMRLIDTPQIIVPPQFLFPVQDATKKNISSFFGVQRNHPEIDTKRLHGGIDIRAQIGTPVLAAADGIVAKASKEAAWGNLIVISHSDGYETWYAHLKGFNTRQNIVIKKGDIIGYVGMTGNTTGPHLHFELKHYEQSLDPIHHLK